jgi:DNA-binding NtrC family response regulator
MATVVTRFVDKSATETRRARPGEWTELTIQVPPLRERTANVVFLAELFILMSMPLSRRVRPMRLSEQAKVALMQYSWPGNSQELRNVVERAMMLATGDVIGLEHLPAELVGGLSSVEQHASAPCEKPMSLREEIEALEKKRILEALQKYPTQRDAAAALDMPMSTFLTRLDAFGIPRVRGGGKAAKREPSRRNCAA